MRIPALAAACIATAALLTPTAVAGQTPGRSDATTAVHNHPVQRLLIRHAMIIPGTGVPAFGPADILVEDGLIARIGDCGRAGDGRRADAVIDATGKYVMPGIVNTHMHWHEERVGPIPIQYERDLYLAAGVTTAREVGGDFEKAKQWRAESAAHTIVAPAHPALSDARGPPAERARRTTARPTRSARSCAPRRSAAPTA